MNDSKPDFAIWFSKFRQYDTAKLGAAGVVLFNFLIFRARGKNYGEFPITDAIILDECGIKRTQLESLTKRFEEMGFLTTRTKGIQNPTNYFVDFKKLATPEIARQLTKPVFLDELIHFFKQESMNQLAAQSSKKSTKGSENSLGVKNWEISELIKAINDVYAQRVRMYNDAIKESPQIDKRKKTVTGFHLSKTEKFNLIKLYASIDKDIDAIQYALMVFFDEVLNEKRQIKVSILSYFLTAGEDNDFPVFRECLNAFKLTYGYK
ncbi:MAG: hypothetical protein J0M29_06565 [Chitinophagales bacterium]|nr:hypothetical protein [Chitinophagales bacterium]